MPHNGVFNYKTNCILKCYGKFFGHYEKLKLRFGLTANIRLEAAVKAHGKTGN